MIQWSHRQAVAIFIRRYDMQNIRSYRKMMRELKVGDKFYFNSISGSLSMIDYTRELIQTGKITPDSEELNKMVKPEAQYKFYNGTSIAPQMTYRVIA